MTSSCRSNEMTPLPILLAAVYFVSGNCCSNRSRELFPLIAASMFPKFKRNRYESYRDIFGRGFIWLEIRYKLDNLDVRPLYVTVNGKLLPLRRSYLHLYLYFRGSRSLHLIKIYVLVFIEQ